MILELGSVKVNSRMLAVVLTRNVMWVLLASLTITFLSLLHVRISRVQVSPVFLILNAN